MGQLPGATDVPILQEVRHASVVVFFPSLSFCSSEPLLRRRTKPGTSIHQHQQDYRWHAHSVRRDRYFLCFPHDCNSVAGGLVEWAFGASASPVHIFIEHSALCDRLRQREPGIDGASVRFCSHGSKRADERDHENRSQWLRELHLSITRGLQVRVICCSLSSVLELRRE